MLSCSVPSATCVSCQIPTGNGFDNYTIIASQGLSTLFTTSIEILITQFWQIIHFPNSILKLDS